MQEGCHKHNNLLITKVNIKNYRRSCSTEKDKHVRGLET